MTDLGAWPREPSHRELIEAGARWLFRHRGCKVVVTEMTGGSEIVDALGFSTSYSSMLHSASSSLIECKVSLSDMARDRHKPVRRHPEIGVGHERWYLVPDAMLEAARGMLLDGWGLLYARAAKQRRWGFQVRVDYSHLPVLRTEYAVHHETRILLSCLQRVGLAAVEAKIPVSMNVYRFEPPSSVTLGVRYIAPEGKQ